MDDFPKNFDDVLKKVAQKNKFDLAKETHYDAINRELIWYTKNIRKRLDFTLIDNVIKVTFYKDRFPFCARIFVFCHRYIPLCPLFAKIEWFPLNDLASGENESFYFSKINNFVGYVERVNSGNLGDTKEGEELLG